MKQTKIKQIVWYNCIIKTKTELNCETVIARFSENPNFKVESATCIKRDISW